MLLEGYEFKSPKKAIQDERKCDREQQDKSEEEDAIDDATDHMSSLDNKFRQTNDAALAERLQEEYKEPVANQQEQYHVVNQDGPVVHLKRRKKKKHANLSKRQQ